MKQQIEYTEARELLLSAAQTVGEETLPLEACGGRVLARALYARANVPPFDRSAYDGYAFRAADIAQAAPQAPVTLRVLGEIPAGSVGTMEVTDGTAVKILTGAPIPKGADCVIKYELTEYTDGEVKLFAPMKSGANIVRAGEDVREGQLLAPVGTVIDAGLAATLASQAVAAPWVFRRPCVGLISTGSELREPSAPPEAGKIYNANRYALEAELQKLGCQTRYFGIAGDCVSEIAERMQQALDCCDALILTGGVSVGDYDLTPAAMEYVGAEILIRGVKMKPGMACAYAVRDGKLLFGLSGNPAAAMTQLYVLVAPALRKMSGRREVLPKVVTAALAEPFPKGSRLPRFLRGTLELSEGRARLLLPHGQGNAVASSLIGSDVLALIPAERGPLAADTQLKGFLL